MVSSLSLFCLVGVITGIFINRHQSLVPVDKRQVMVDACLGQNPPPACMLRSAQIDAATIINQKKDAGKITPDEAYDQLRKLLLQDSAGSGK